MPVAKGGNVLLVHPTCLAAHKSQGWVEAPAMIQSDASGTEWVTLESFSKVHPIPAQKRPVGRPRKHPNPMTEHSNVHS